MTIDVATLGETMFLVAPDAPLIAATRAHLSEAGAESNVASALAWLGSSSAWVSRVGADTLGARTVAAIGGKGVDVSSVVAEPVRPTGLYVKDPSPTGTRVVYYRAGSAASAMDRGDVDRALGLAPRILHLSGITLALSATCADAVRYALERATVPTSFDVNYRPALWQSRDSAATALRQAADLASIVFVGLDEAQALWGTSTAAHVRDLLPGPDYLLVKDADIEATCFGPNGVSVVPARQVAVVEPVGAGDAFAAGWLHAHLKGLDQTHALVAGHLVAGVVLMSPTDEPLPSAMPISIEQIVAAANEAGDVAVS